jgi:hypothetical protein
VVRIVSGAQKDPNIALLQGMQIGRGALEAQNSKAREERAQMDQALQMRQIQMQFQKARADRETMLNQQAQMGNAQAIQEAALRQKMDPTEQLAKDAMEMLDGITDPKARAQAMPAIKSLVDEHVSQRKMQTAQTEIERAAKDGILDPNTEPLDPTKPKKPGALPSIHDYQARLQSGEDPDALVKDLSKARMQRATAAANAEDNMAAFEQAKMRVDAAPPGREKQLARIALKEFEMSPSRMEDEGGGAKLLAAIQETLVGPLSRQDAIAESTKAWGENKPAPGLQGMSVGQRNEEMMKEPTGPVGFGLFGNEFGAGGPNVPPFTGGTHATLRGTNRKGSPEDDDLGKLLASATSDEDLASKLNSAGIPKTPENVRAIQERRRALTGR